MLSRPGFSTTVSAYAVEGLTPWCRMLNTERDRSLYLQKQLVSQGIRLNEFLSDHYTAILVHSSSTIVTANQALADLVGYTISELQGMNAWNLFPPQSVAIVTEQLALRSESPYQVDVKRKDGSLVRAELKGINFDIAGEPARAILARELPTDPFMADSHPPPARGSGPRVG
jgi:PAS domain S-box-containing protein